MSQVWDAVSGRTQYTFEGHEAPVYSVCPHYKENIQVDDYSLLLFMFLRNLSLNPESSKISIGVC